MSVDLMNVSRLEKHELVIHKQKRGVLKLVRQPTHIL